MITTPEQMREAAARDNDLIRRGNVTAIPILGMTVTQIERAIRAIPIAPQPVAVKVKPLVWISLGKGYMANDPLFQTTAMALSSERCAEYDAERADRILSALTIHPADPLSDPRVVALVEAATKLELSNDTICGARPHWLYEHMLAAGLSDHLINLDDARGNLRAALRAIGGEA